MKSIRKAVDSAEATQFKAQAFRFVRLTIIGAAAVLLAGGPVTVALVGPALLSAAEVAFRAVFV